MSLSIIMTLTKALNIASRLGHRSIKKFSGSKNYIVADIVLKLLFYFTLTFTSANIEDLIVRIIIINLFDAIILDDIFDAEETEAVRRYKKYSDTAPYIGVILGFMIKLSTE